MTLPTNRSIINPREMAQDIDDMVKHVSLVKSNPLTSQDSKREVDAKIVDISKLQLAITERLGGSIKEYLAALYYPVGTLCTQALFVRILRTLRAEVDVLVSDNKYKNFNMDEQLSTEYMEPGIDPLDVIRAGLWLPKSMLRLSGIGFEGYILYSRGSLLKGAKERLKELQSHLVSNPKDVNLKEAVKKLEEFIAKESDRLSAAKKAYMVNFGVSATLVTREIMLILKVFNQLGSRALNVVEILTCASVFIDVIKEGLYYKDYKEKLAHLEGAEAISDKDMYALEIDRADANTASAMSIARLEALKAKRKLMLEERNERNIARVDKILQDARKKAGKNFSLTLFIEHLKANHIDLYQAVYQCEDSALVSNYHRLLFHENFDNQLLDFEVQGLTTILKNFSLEQLKEKYKKNPVVQAWLKSLTPIDYEAFKKDLLEKDFATIQKIVSEVPALKAIAKEFGRKRIKTIVSNKNASEGEKYTQLKNLFAGYPVLQKMLEAQGIMGQLDQFLSEKALYKKINGLKKLDETFANGKVQDSLLTQFSEHQEMIEMSTKNALKALEKKKIGSEKILSHWNKNTFLTLFVVDLLAGVLYYSLVGAGVVSGFALIPFFISVGVAGVMMIISLCYIKKHRPNLYKGWNFNVPFHVKYYWKRYSLDREENKLFEKQKAFYGKAAKCFQNMTEYKMLHAFQLEFKRALNAVNLQKTPLPQSLSDKLMKIFKDDSLDSSEKINAMEEMLKTLVEENEKASKELEVIGNEIKTLSQEIAKHQAEVSAIEEVIEQAKVADLEGWDNSARPRMQEPAAIIAKAVQNPVVDSVGPLGLEAREFLKHRLGVDVEQLQKEKGNVEEKIAQALTKFFTLDENELATFMHQRTTF